MTEEQKLQKETSLRHSFGWKKKVIKIAIGLVSRAN
jgi:hypothetical protein